MKYPTMQESHKERYDAWLNKIRRDPGPLITTSLIEKCSCQLQGQLTNVDSTQLVDTFPWVFVTDQYYRLMLTHPKSRG